MRFLSSISVLLCAAVAAAAAAVAASAESSPEELGNQVLRAVQSGDLQSLKDLVKRGADVNVKNQYSVSALHLAAADGNIDAMDILIHANASVDSTLDQRARHREGETPLHFACADNKPDAVEFLLNHGAASDFQTVGGMTALHVAAGLGNVHVMRILLDYSADVNAVAGNRYGSMPIHLAATSGKVESTKLLLQHNADANAVNLMGSYPIHGAAMVGDVASVRLLIEYGADHKAENGDKQTPLAAAEARIDSDPVVEANIEELRQAFEDAEEASRLDKQTQAESEL